MNITMYMHYLILCKAHCIIQIVCSVLYVEYDIIHKHQRCSIQWKLILKIHQEIADAHTARNLLPQTLTLYSKVTSIKINDLWLTCFQQSTSNHLMKMKSFSYVTVLGKLICTFLGTI